LTASVKQLQIITLHCWNSLFCFRKIIIREWSQWIFVQKLNDISLNLNDIEMKR